MYDNPLIKKIHRYKRYAIRANYAHTQTHICIDIIETKSNDFVAFLTRNKMNIKKNKILLYLTRTSS